jgi:diacylglycerol kinase (ATP)
MILLINSNANSGKAPAKWKTIETLFCDRKACIYQSRSASATEQTVHHAIHRGETDIVAAGGDGTLNIVLNAILATADPEKIRRIRLGAIGLGSSNDFHKPFAGSSSINGFPCKTDFASARYRDVGCVEFKNEAGFHSRYFLINASLGATAEANALFNSPGRLLGLMKRLHTPSAILIAALRTISKFRNMETSLELADGREHRVQISNLGILKSPHFSGTLRYNVPASYADGLLRVVLCEGVGRAGLLKLLLTLSQNSLRKHFPLESWTTRSIAVRANAPFALEFDGEVVKAREARFSVIPQCLKVCAC